MVTYMDLLKRLRNMTHQELMRPVMIATRTHLTVAKSLCEAGDYAEGKLAALPDSHLIIDIVNDACEDTHHWEKSG